MGKKSREKRNRRAGGGAFGGPKPAGLQPIRAQQIPAPQPIEWAEVTNPKQREAMEEMRRLVPNGRLVRSGAEIGWLYTYEGVLCLGSADENGEIQLHSHLTPA
ncbi:MAG TPA: hypothetical protein VEB66_02270 [Opitutaceae bacterium]|nr:hypothetical protein [Opitutaceae bacterium]